jgi:hypothetical protein
MGAMNMDNMTLWEEPPRRVNSLAFIHHSETSFEAGDAIRSKAGNLRERVLDLLKTGAYTDEQIAVKLAMNPSTARPRRVELYNAGLIDCVGFAQTSSGRRSQLWTATPTEKAR